MDDDVVDPIIRFEHVFKAFGDRTILRDVSFAIPRGQTTVLIGPSGVGKSVLIKHVVGLVEPDAGHVWVGDVDMAHASERQRYAVRRRFGMMFQNGALFDSLTVGENVAFPLRYHTRMTERQQRERAEEVLAMVELPGIGERSTASLSGGQRKRVSLARAIVLEPEVVVFDEPNSGLDPLTAGTIDGLISRMKERLGITFVVITHDIVSTVHIADRIGMLWGGRLVEYAPRDAFLRSRQEIVRRFLSRDVDLPEPDGPLIPVPE